MLLLPLSLAIAPVAHALDYTYSWSLPKPQGNQLRAVVFEADDLTGYAVGDGGAVVATSDGGITWSVRTATGSFSEDLNDVMLLAPGELLAVGSAPGMYRSTDAGTTWNVVASPSTGTLFDVARVSGTTLCALGTSGQVLRSTDDGLTWTQRPSPKNTTLKDQLWLDANLGYVLGYQCARRTTDGGASWSALPGVSETGIEDFNEVWALDPQHVTIHADFHTARTTNSGASWTFEFVPNELVYQSTTVVLSPTRRLVSSILEGVAVYETTDDGLNWTPRLIDFEAQGMTDLIRLTNGALIGVTTDGDLYRSTDVGVSWANATHSPDDEERVTIAAFARTNDGTIYAGSTQPGQALRRFHKSTDGGDSFFKVPDPPINFLNALIWLDGDVLLAGGNGGSGSNRVWRSSNQAATWTSHTLPNNFSNGVQCLDLESVSATTVYAVGYGSSGSAIFWSTDSGVTWAQRTTGIPSSTALFSVDFIDTQSGFAGGASGSSPRIYRTTDAGANWTSVGTSGLSTSVTDMKWFDAQTAVVALGQQAQGIYRTTNGGGSWSQVDATLVSRFSFADATRGYAPLTFQIGGVSTIVETTDAGVTWSLRTLPTTQGASSVFATPDGFFAGGYRSTILRGSLTNPTTVDDPRRHASLDLALLGSVGATPTLRFTATTDGSVRARVIDAQGRLVRTLLDADVRAGQLLECAWDGRDDAGRVAAAGVYFVRVESGDAVGRGRVTLMRP